MSDIIIIGAGPGGYKAALRAAAAGKEVTLIEQRSAPGGTCLHEGCIPTKCLCRTAELLGEVKEAAGGHGIHVELKGFSFSEAMRRKDAVVGTLVSGLEVLKKTPGLTYVEGAASLSGQGADGLHHVQVGQDEYCAPAVILALGSEPKFLPIPGAHLPGVITSTELLSLGELPERLCIIGGGVIGLELASVMQAFGSQVTVVEYAPEVLPFFDRDLSKRLRLALKKRGITFYTGAEATAIEQAESGELTLRFQQKGGQGIVVADKILMAVGRAPRRGAINLDEAGIAYTRRGVTVDENMQTSVPGIYAVGDINGLMQLAHAATFQSYRALSHILGQQDSLRLDIVPAAVFTTPELAMVGKTEQQLQALGTPYRTLRSSYRSNGKALSLGPRESEGAVKVLSDSEGHILGAHILGAHAADLIHELALAMQADLSAEEVASMVHAHPTLSEVVMESVGQC